MIKFRGNAPWILAVFVMSMSLVGIVGCGGSSTTEQVTEQAPAAEAPPAEMPADTAMADSAMSP